MRHFSHSMKSAAFFLHISFKKQQQLLPKPQIVKWSVIFGAPTLFDWLWLNSIIIFSSADPKTSTIYGPYCNIWIFHCTDADVCAGKTEQPDEITQPDQRASGCVWGLLAFNKCRRLPDREKFPSAHMDADIPPPPLTNTDTQLLLRRLICGPEGWQYGNAKNRKWSFQTLWEIMKNLWLEVEQILPLQRVFWRKCIKVQNKNSCCKITTNCLQKSFSLRQAEENLLFRVS